MRDYMMRGYTTRSMDACNPTAFINSPRRTEPVTLRMLPEGQLPAYLLAEDETHIDQPAPPTARADAAGGAEGMERVDQLLQDLSVRQRLWSIACMAQVRGDSGLILQHFASFAIAPTKEEASQVARQLAVKQWPGAEQWDAWVQEIPESVIAQVAEHQRTVTDEPRAGQPPQTEGE